MLARQKKKKRCPRSLPAPLEEQGGKGGSKVDTERDVESVLRTFVSRIVKKLAFPRRFGYGEKEKGNLRKCRRGLYISIPFLFKA